MFINGGSAEILWNTVLDNHAVWAGGLRIINDAEVLVLGNRIQENTADISGGGVQVECCGNATSRIIRNLIQGNEGGGRGGGVHISGTRAILENNILAGNQATLGSGIYLEGFQPDPDSTLAILTHNTLVGEGSAAQALYIGSFLNAQVVNNIMAGHMVGIPTPPAESAVNARYNLFWNQSDPFTGADAVLADPLLDAAFHLLAGSPAINAGTLVEIREDFDGDLRPFGGGYDIGADEFAIRTYLPLARRD